MVVTLVASINRKTQLTLAYEKRKVDPETIVNEEVVGSGPPNQAAWVWLVALTRAPFY